MTTSVRAGGVYGASVPQRPLPAGSARSQEWQTLYQRQLAQEGVTAEGQDGSAQGARDLHADALAAQSGARRDGRSAPDPSRVAAAANLSARDGREAEWEQASGSPAAPLWSASAAALASALSGSHAACNNVGAAQADVATLQSVPQADGRPKPDRYRVALIAAGEQAIGSRSPILPHRIGIEAGLPQPAGGETLARTPPGRLGAGHGVGAAQAAALSSQSAMPAGDRPDSEPSGIAVVARAGQPYAASIATAASGLLPQMNVLPEPAPVRGTPAPSACDDRQVDAGVGGSPTVPREPESDKTLARAISAPAALALPAAILAQAGALPGSQQTSHRLSSAEKPLDAVATSAIAAQRAGAAAGAGAGTAQQRGGDSANHQRSPRDAFSTESGSGRHYGTFPLIVSGELLELDFVSLRSGRTPPAGAAVSRIFVSVQPPGMGRLELTAQNLGDRVTVSFGGQAVRGGSTPALDVPALLQRLGWGAYPVKVDGVIP